MPIARQARRPAQVTRSRAWYVRCALAAALTIGLSRQATHGLLAQQQPPTFRSGVDIVQLDVTVLDRNRKPVRGLTAADFALLEDGIPQRIVSVTPVDLPEPAPVTAAWMRDVAPDVVRNDADIGRVITIVFDDAHTGNQGAFWDPWVLKTGTRIARDVVNSLGPQDRAAVTFTFMGRRQNFTADHARLLKAIDSFRPKDSPTAGPPLGCAYRGAAGSGCVIDTLEHVADALPTLPPRRKVIVFISNGDAGVTALAGDTAMHNRDPHTPELDQAVQMFRRLQQANVTVYAFSPHGLQIHASLERDGAFQTFAEQTGGRAVLQTNTPWDGVPTMFDETRSYYLVAFQTAHRDGKFHRLTVTAGRPDLEVRTRTGYIAPESERAAARRKAPILMAPLEAAMSSGFPESTVPLAASLASFATPGQREMSVLVTSRVAPPADGAGATSVNLRVTAFDENWNDKATVREAVALTPETSGSARVAGDVLSTLKLRPGRYEIRLGAEAAGQGGSLFADLEVPDVSKARLSTSGVVLGRPLTGPASGLVAALRLPVEPTLARTFDPSDVVAAFLRVYQGGRNTVAPVSLRTTIFDEHGNSALDATSLLAADRFTGDRSADVRVDLPLARLARGEYLLTIETTLADLCLPATLRFRVQ
jgi:VWFA-related protein